MIEQILQRGMLITVIALVVCVLGILAAIRVPVQMIPDLEVRRIAIETFWAGATPQDVEREIIIEQEEYLRTIQGLQRMKSQARTGKAEIELEFPFGVDISRALLDVNNALAQVPSYPENVDQPKISATSFSQNSFMYLRVVAETGNPLGLDMDLMLDFVEDNVRPRLERVKGVAQIRVRGGAERQVQVEVDAAALAERGLSLSDVRQAIRSRNRDRSAGDIDNGTQRFLLRVTGRLDEPEALEQLIIARRGNALVRLGEVATVRLDHFEPRGRDYTDGEAAIGLQVRRLAGSNVVQIKRDVLIAMEEINQRVLEPVGLNLRLIADDVTYVEASVRNVWTNLALGALLATVVMFLFMRSLPATLVGVIGIPVCTIAAFIGLLSFGRTINVISLAGVAFSIGMTLDNSIVVLEAIERERRKTQDRLAAAANGVRRVWPAVLASTMTTVLVFAPILFIAEEAGQLYSDVAVAIASAILVSMLVATTLVPAATLRLSKLGSTSGKSVGVNGLQTGLLRALNWVLAKPARRGLYLLATVLLTSAIIWGLTPDAEYLPEGEEPKTFARMIAPPGYTLTEMERIALKIQEELQPYIGDDPDRYRRGEAPYPAIAYYNMYADANSLWLVSQPVDPSQINDYMDELTQRFRAEPGMRAFAARGSIISSNDGGTRSVNVDVSAADLEQLFAAAQAIHDRAREVLPEAQIGSEPSSLSLTQPMMRIQPQWERLAEAGLAAEDFAFAVAAISDGAFVDEFFLGDDKIDIFVFSDAGYRQSIDGLANAPLHTPNGVIPLSAVASLVETVDTDQIRRINGRRTVTLNIVSPRDIPLEQAVKTVQADVIDYLKRERLIPEDVQLDISGAADQLDATRQALSGNFLVALLLSYLLLVAIFSHWGYPLIILTTVPLGIAGGIAGLALMNLFVRQPFDMISMLGFLILLGTVVNNPILIVDQALSRLREGARSVEEAVTGALQQRLRPVMMSMITTIFGLSPLVFVPGAGTELYRGVGAIVLFGLLFSTLITISFLPVLLTTLFKFRSRASVAAQT